MFSRFDRQSNDIDFTAIRKLASKIYLSVLSRVLRDSTPRYVDPSVGRLVGWSVGRSPFLAAAPKAPMTYAFTQEKFLLLLLLLLLLICPPPSKLILLR